MMGITASLFYNANDPDKQTLHRRITPSQEQFDDQQERWNALADHLTSDLEERSGHRIRTWLQGSYKFGTQVRPARKGDEFDIDLGVFFQWKGEPEEGDHEPDELKDMVQRSLESYSDDGVIEVVSPPRSRCSRIRYEGDFHIDVPSYHLDPDRDARMLATEDDGWEDSDPKALFLWFRDRFDDHRRAKARRQIRYVKRWATLKYRDSDGRPSSTLLTVLVAEALDELSDDDLASDDDALLAVLEVVLDRLEGDREVHNPANDDEVLSDRLNDDELDEFTDELRRFRDTAQGALDCENIVAAADKWSEAFEHFFPLPDEEELAKAAESGQRLLARVVVPEVNVRAVARNNPNRKWVDTNKIGPIPKDCTIDFRVTNSHALPNDATVQWMVRNEGDEAEYTNDLGHYAGDGLTADERSAYKGTHYMDCVVRQHGLVIGLQRIRVTITGISMPRRNPKKRPNYVRHRGKR